MPRMNESHNVDRWCWVNGECADGQAPRRCARKFRAHAEEQRKCGVIYAMCVGAGCVNSVLGVRPLTNCRCARLGIAVERQFDSEVWQLMAKSILSSAPAQRKAFELDQSRVRPSPSYYFRAGCHPTDLRRVSALCRTQHFLAGVHPLQGILHPCITPPVASPPTDLPKRGFTNRFYRFCENIP